MAPSLLVAPGRPFVHLFIPSEASRTIGAGSQPTSALPQKQTNSRSSRYVGFVPKCMARPCGTRWTSKIDERESCINVSASEVQQFATGHHEYPRASEADKRKDLE